MRHYRDCCTGWTTGVQFPAGEVVEFFFLSATTTWFSGPFSLLSYGWRGLLPVG